jgi:replicative DNA helicase
MSEDIPEGARNQTMTQICGKIMHGQRTSDYETVVWPLLSSFNLAQSNSLPIRELRTIFESVARLASGNKDGPKPMTPQLEAVISGKTIEEAMAVSNPKPYSSVKWTEVLQMGMDEQRNTKPEDCMPFGYRFLDEALTGIFPAELVVLGGGSGTGKSQLTTNLISKAAADGHKTFSFALEDRLEDYGMRFLYNRVNVIRKRTGRSCYPWNDYRRNVIKDPAFPELMQQAKRELSFEGASFAMIDRKLKPEDIIAAVYDLAKLGYTFLSIDHLHWLDLDGERNNRSVNIERFMVDLRMAQIKTGMRVWLVVQYKKLGAGGVPDLESFKDAQAITHNASYIINLWRERGESATDITKKGKESRFQVMADLISKNSGRFVETHFLVPKARNANGEQSLTVMFDREKGDYVDGEDLALRQVPEPGEEIPVSKIEW